MEERNKGRENGRKKEKVTCSAINPSPPFFLHSLDKNCDAIQYKEASNDKDIGQREFIVELKMGVRVGGRREVRLVAP